MQTYFTSRIESEPIKKLECQKIFAESLDYFTIYKRLSRVDVEFFPYHGYIFFIGQASLIKKSLGLNSNPQQYEIVLSDIDGFRIGKALLYSCFEKHLQQHGFSLLSKQRERRGKIAIFTGENRDGIEFMHQVREDVIAYEGICFQLFVNRLTETVEIWLDPKVSALISLNTRELPFGKNWLVTLCRNESCDNFTYCKFLLKNIVKFKALGEPRYVDPCPITQTTVTVNDEFFNEYTVPSEILFEESSSYNLKQRGCYWDILQLSLKWTDNRLEYLKTFLDILSNGKEIMTLNISEDLSLKFQKNLIMLECEDYDASKMY
jgi:hypothetical protein